MTYSPGVLHELLAHAARQWPNRTALTCRGTSATYAELAAAAERVAASLAARGTRRGDRLLISAPASTLLPAVLFGAARAGVAFSLLHEQVRGGSLDHVLADSEPVLMVTGDDDVRRSAEAAGVPAVSVEDLAAGPGRDVTLPAPPLPVDPVCLIYTSGTTSLPKAVVSTHQQMLFAVRAIASVLEYRSDDVVYSPLPLSFDYGLYQVFLSATAGSNLVMGAPTEVGPSLVGNLVRANATVLPAVPAVAEALSALLRRRPKPAPALRLLTNTGAAMPTGTLGSLRQAIPGLRVQLMFGLTECKRATIMPVDGDLDRPGSSGRALPGTEVFVIGESGERLPAGEVGEIVVRGPNVMAGYWRRPELTEEKFPRVDGLFPELRTGDYGRLDEEGYLYFDGRRDDIYKERGFRVSATEVETAARGVPGVREAAVLVPKDTRPAWLFVTGDLAAEGVLDAMRTRIEEFKIPASCLRVGALPLTGNGKVDRKALASMVEEVAGGAAR
ncbi:class I adenylate-forming enzyme family protein [Amycolatopsis sp. NPDC051106]|uniref:class I adenylate-forming enzyme family protein n=3 Tax=unclassified Amycolatopsis TaxID=2618356 RepID=UPI00344845DD